MEQKARPGPHQAAGGSGPSRLEKYLGRPVRDEGELYGMVREADEGLENSGARTHLYLSMGEEDRFSYRSLGYRGKECHVLGETHFSMKPILHFHERILPQVQAAPGRWLFLVEGAESIDEIRNRSELLLYLTGAGYYLEVAHLSGIPVEPALTGLYCPDTRRYISEEIGVPRHTLDKVLIRELLGDVPLQERMVLIKVLTRPEDSNGEERFRGGRIIDRIAVELQEAPHYVARIVLEVIINILKRRPDDDSGISAQYDHHWNRYSRQRLDRLLGEYQDKDLVLLVVGLSHLVIFDGWTDPHI